MKFLSFFLSSSSLKYFSSESMEAPIDVGFWAATLKADTLTVWLKFLNCNEEYFLLKSHSNSVGEAQNTQTASLAEC